MHAARMVPSGAFGLPRTEDSGSVRAERWEEANRSKSDPPPRVHKEKTLQYVPAPHGTPIEGIEIRGSQIIKVEASLPTVCPLWSMCPLEPSWAMNDRRQYSQCTALRPAAHVYVRRAILVG